MTVAVGNPKVARSAPHAFTQDDMNQLLQVLEDGKVPARPPWPIRGYGIITTLAVTGLRASELLDLSAGDVEGLPDQHPDRGAARQLR